MILIALCDDQQNDLVALNQSIAAYFEQKQRSCRIDLFSCGDDLLRSSTKYQIIFLDILLENENGVDIARQMRIDQRETIIVFISQSGEFMQAGYKAKAFRYLLKPLDQLSFTQELNEILYELEVNNQVVELGETREIVYLNQILVIIKQKRLIEFYTDNEVIKEKGTFERFVDRFSDKGFIVCSKGILVNLAAIKKITRSLIIMRNDQTVPVSRRLYKHVVEERSRYMGKKA